MAVTDQVTAREMGQAYAELVRGEATAKRLWVSTSCCEVNLWLLTEPIDHDAELRLYGAGIRLYDRFETGAFLHVLNPALSEGSWDPTATIPREAEEIRLRPE